MKQDPLLSPSRQDASTSWRWLLAALLAVVCGCQRQATNAPAANAATSASDEPPARVTVIKPTRKLLQRRCEQPGEVMALEETPIYARVAGYVQEVNVDIGTKVMRGQTMAVIAVPELHEEVKQKEALVAQATAQIAQARAAMVVAEAMVETAQAKVAAAQAAILATKADVQRWKSESARVEELATRSAVTRKVADEVLNQLRAAEGTQQEAEAQVKSAQAAVRESQARLTAAGADADAATANLTVAEAERDRSVALADYATIKAPFDGVVNERHIHTGHYVQPGTAREKPLFAVAHSERVRITVNVPETDAGFLQPGDEATVRIPALDNKKFVVPVTRAAESLEKTTRTLRAEIEIENSSGELRPGMYCHVSILVDQRPDALVLPSTAVMMDAGKPVCAALVEGKIARLPLELGLRTTGEVEIIGGLTGNEAVIPKNPATLRVGQTAELLPQ